MKYDKKDVKYTDGHGDSDEWCAKCGHFEKPKFCAIVAGNIDPQGWCMKYFLKPSGFEVRPFMFRGEAA